MSPLLQSLQQPLQVDILGWGPAAEACAAKIDTVSSLRYTHQTATNATFGC